MKTLAEAIAAIEQLQAQVKELQDGATLKQRGPKTDRAMTEEDAFRVKFGDLKQPMNHKEAAGVLGLSYGQVFSCRGGYTFKHVKASWKPKDAAPDQTEEPK